MDIVKICIESNHLSLSTYLQAVSPRLSPQISLKLPSTEAFASICFNFQYKEKHASLFPLTTGLGLGVYTLPSFGPLKDLVLLGSETSGLGSTIDLTGSITDGVGT